VPPTARDLRQLPAPQRRLLQLIFDQFSASAEWPLVDGLQHELDISGEELDITAIAGQIDHVLGHVDALGYQGRGMLTVHGVSLCSGSGPVLADLLCLVQLEYARYVSGGAGAQITSDDMLASCGIDGLRLRRTRALVEPLPGWQSISGGPEAPWTLQISREARRFKAVTTVDELLAKVPLPGYPDAVWPLAPATAPARANRPPRPLIGAPVISAFKDCFVSREALRAIDEFFGDLDFRYDKDAYDRERAAGHGERRSTAAGYIATLDLGDALDAERLLKAIAARLSEWEQNGDPQFRRDLDRLIRALDVGGFSWNGRTLVRRAGALIIDEGGRRLYALGIEDVNQEIERIAGSMDSDPADAITAARALLESVCKAVLDELGEPINETDDLPTLYKKTAAALKLDPVQHEVVYRQILQGLVSAVHGLAEVRNKLGDAHGKGRAAVRPTPRHARLAAGAASTVATFLVETMEERARTTRG
jgi:hypothetical protein